MHRPALLEPGAPVALIAPSAHLRSDQRDLAEQAMQLLQEEWGLNLRYVADLERRHLHLAGSDAARAAELQQQLEDPTVQAIFCFRGGYGAARLLPHLQPERWSTKPRWLIGFSDVTLLLHALQRETGWLVCHGPSVASPQFVQGPEADHNRQALHDLLFDGLCASFPVQFLQGSQGVEGRLSGGCLSVLLSALGTPYEVDFSETVLFLEEINEAPYRLDRMLTQLRHSGRLAQVRAIVFGEFHRCGTNVEVEAVLRDVLSDLGVPLAVGLPVGHGVRNEPLVLGEWVRLDPQTQTLHYQPSLQPTA